MSTGFVSFQDIQLNLGAVNVHLPKDRISMAHQGYGFCEFLTEEDAEYACKIMNQIKLWGKPIRVNKVRPLRAVPVEALRGRLVPSTRASCRDS